MFRFFKKWGGGFSLRSELEMLWDNDYRGRILLANFANQIERGILGDGVLERLRRTALTRPETFGSRDSLLGNRFPGRGETPVSKLFFETGIRPEVDKTKLYARVVALTPLLWNLKNGSTASRVLKAAIKDGPEDDANKRSRRYKALKALLRKQFPCNNNDLKMLGMPPGAAQWEWFQAEFTGKIGFREADEPIFLTELTADGSFDQVFDRALNLPDPADLFRDVLGLDMLDRAHPSAPTGSANPIGVFIFTEEQLGSLKLARPSPFDATSKARFRAAYGDHKGSTGLCGRTANLAKIGTREIEGAPEVVVENKNLQGSKTVFFAFIGEPVIPRKDVYDETTGADPTDEMFLGHCLGKRDKDAVIDLLLG